MWTQAEWGWSGVTRLHNLNRVNDGLSQLLKSPLGKRRLESSRYRPRGLGKEGGGEGEFRGFDGYRSSVSHTRPTALYYATGFRSVQPAN